MLLKNCTIIDPETREEETKDILVRNGKIIDIAENIPVNANDFDELIMDINGKYVMPGFIDPHTHLREPGMEHKEDFFTGSMAAAAGGYTSIIDMPDTEPKTTSIGLLDEKKELADKSIVNFGFHFAGENNNIEEIKKARDTSCSASTFIDMDSDLDDESIGNIFNESDLVTVYAKGKTVEKALDYSKKTKTKLYLCHISKREELDMIRDFKEDNPEDGERIYVEATPHHLLLSLEDDNDGFTKTNPPLRELMDQEDLWTAISEGLINTIGTDHAPHTVGEKLQEESPLGVPGLETTIPLLLNQIASGRISLDDIQKLCSEAPAKIFGIAHKGMIATGYDADFTIIDLEHTKTVDENKLYTKCGWSPFKDWELKGWPIMTIVRGNIVFDEFQDERINQSKEGKILIFE